MNKNFEDFKRYIQKNTKIKIDINAETAELISNLKNPNITEKFDDVKWKEITIKAVGSFVPELMLAIVKSKHFPEKYLTPIVSKLERVGRDEILLTSEYIPDELIKKIINNRRNKEDFIDTYGADFSRKVINYLCTKSTTNELQEMGYTPFKFVQKVDHEALLKINKLIKNKGNAYFGDEIPEKFTSIIACNENVFDIERNLAFDIGYNPDDVFTGTPHMVKELYKSYADILFDFPDINDDSIKQLMQDAKNRLCTWIANDEIPESCQIDLMERYCKSSKAERRKNTAIGMILWTCTKYPSVLLKAIELNPQTFSYLIKESRPETIDWHVINATLKTGFRSEKDLQAVALASIYYNPVNMRVYQSFIDKGCKYIDYAIVSSSNSSMMDINSIFAQENDIDKKLIFSYLKEIRNLCVDFMPNKNSDQIIKYVVRDIIEREPQTTERDLFIDVLNESKPERWSIIYKNDYTILKKKCELLMDKYPMMEATTQLLSEKIEEEYKKSQFAIKWPDIFRVNYKTPYQGELLIPYDEINEEILFGKVKHNIEIFNEDLKECGDKDIATSILTSLKQMENYVLDPLKYDTIIDVAYKFSDTYAVIEEILSGDKSIEEKIASKEMFDCFER